MAAAAGGQAGVRRCKDRYLSLMENEPRSGLLLYLAGLVAAAGLAEVGHSLNEAGWLWLYPPLFDSDRGTRNAFSCL